MKYTRENIEEGINNKLERIYGDEKNFIGEKNIYKKKLIDYPVEIEQNILEWINDLPITEVDCHGESVLKTMQLFDLPDYMFPEIVIAFIKFKKNGFCSNAVLYHQFML